VSKLEWASLGPKRTGVLLAEQHAFDFALEVNFQLLAEQHVLVEAPMVDVALLDLEGK
jgi:hypothetical protein